jgi:hypothetical protein
LDKDTRWEEGRDPVTGDYFFKVIVCERDAREMKPRSLVMIEDGIEAVKEGLRNR